MESDVQDRGVAAAVAQKFINDFFRSGMLDLARFARRKLADERGVDRVTPVRDAGDLQIW